MTVSASDIKELRERTGAGMTDCKTALEESSGDMEKAIEWLRERGAAKAAKKSGRIAAEGLIGISINGATASIVEVNSETDFVAKNADFVTYVQDIANEALKTSAKDLEGFLKSNWQESSKTVEDTVNEKVATIGEKISIRRFEKLDASNGVISSYAHNGGKIGVVVSAENVKETVEVKEILRNVAMQVAAISPLFVSKEDVPNSYIEKEKEIILATMKEDESNKGKPEDILKKMVEGKLTKQLKEVCLLEQSYIKDPDKTVSKYLEEASKASGEKIGIKSFVRYEAGEGIEKKQEDFAEEVAKQMNNK